MSRQARVVAEAVPHHVTQRGNYCYDIFLTDDDRLFYLAILREKSELFVAVLHRSDPLAKALGQAHWRYAMYFNRRYRRSGHVGQNRFYSSPLGPSRLLAALAYADLNPVRAGIVGNPVPYAWSSAAAHLSGEDSRRLLDEWEWSESGLRDGWGETLRTRPDAESEEADSYARPTTAWPRRRTLHFPPGAIRRRRSMECYRRLIAHSSHTADDG